MKVCILTQTFPRFEGDATAPFMLGLCKGLHEAGNEITVVAPYNSFYNKKHIPSYIKLITYKYMWPDFLHVLGYSQTFVNDKYLKGSVLPLGPLLCFFGLLKLIEVIRKEKIDVVSAHWILPNGFIACLAKKFIKVKVVSTLPGSDILVARKNWLYKSLAVFAANTSDGVTSNSPHLKDDLVKFGAKISKFQPIIYSVDTNIFRPIKKGKDTLRKELGIKKYDILILGVGRLVEKKGFLYLIDVAVNAIKKNKNLFFLIVGEGDQRGILEERIKKYNIEDRFLLIGKVSYDKLVMYYNIADTFILPSVRDEEGNLDDQSVSVIEAMSCGKAVISSDFLGYRLVIQNGINGILVKEHNTIELEKAVLKLAASKKMRKEMGDKARERIMKHFTWKKVGEQYTAFFRSI